MNKRIARNVAALSLALVATLGISGCVSATAPTAPSASAEAGGNQADGMTIRDPWVKAVESGMSAAFGILVNEGDAEVSIVSSTSDASPIMELHETVENADGQMIMQEKDGGFPIPAGAEYVLQPGANHLMLMDVVEPIQAGDVVEFAIEFSDGSVYTFTAPVKDYSGANETYVEG